ncbi:hypothetical protein HYPSUDRAFT_181098 [Hypholoma sublateritium FD-334 SS-4]|uniref:DUF6534 domain-containing protein n=1 Tax=Hypholoma sublateritium (strain FD-334 SS-4) TaxID=945553 RepID=A0A0D2P5X7_HYPSF|nr:hypothetical protein HYPSUDRAFT_181098 [Hypholoma sublateritium FD-334 SS-4]
MRNKTQSKQICSVSAERELIGLFLSWMLFGVLCNQIYLYWKYVPNKQTFMKIMVYSIFVLDALQTFLVTENTFHVFGEHFGDIDVSNEVGVTWFAVPIMSGLVASMVQSVYAYRIYMLSKSKIIFASIILLSSVQLTGAIMVGVEAKNAGVITGILGGNESLITAGIWEGGSALCDIIIAVAMTHYLTVLNRGNGNQKIHDLLKKIVRLSIGTGVITATLALVTLAVAYIPTRQSFWITCVMILGKVYSNSIMVALNSRLRIEPNCFYPLWEKCDAAAWHVPRGDTPLVTFSRKIVITRPEQARLGSVSGSFLEV